jgi:hypothetical protein
MQLEELKQQIIDRVGILMTGKYTDHFTIDINECNNGYELLYTLEEYGYNTRDGLDILFSILIK